MKTKRILLVLLAVSIIFNIVSALNARKYRNIVKDNIQTMLFNVFGEAESINIELEKISTDKVITKDQLTKLEHSFDKFITNIQDLRFTVEKIDEKHLEKTGNFESYYFCTNDFSKFSSRITEKSNAASFILSQDDLEYIKRLKKNLYAVEKVKKDNSYTKDDMIYLKMEQWTKIVKELAAVDMMQ